MSYLEQRTCPCCMHVVPALDGRMARHYSLSGEPYPGPDAWKESLYYECPCALDQRSRWRRLLDRLRDRG